MLVPSIAPWASLELRSSCPPSSAGTSLLPIGLSEIHTALSGLRDTVTHTAHALRHLVIFCPPQPQFSPFSKLRLKQLVVWWTLWDHGDHVVPTNAWEKNHVQTWDLVAHVERQGNMCPCCNKLLQAVKIRLQKRKTPQAISELRTLAGVLHQPCAWEPVSICQCQVSTRFEFGFDMPRFWFRFCCLNKFIRKAGQGWRWSHNFNLLTHNTPKASIGKICKV